MRSGGKGMWGRGPALYKHNYKKKDVNMNIASERLLESVPRVLLWPALFMYTLPSAEMLPVERSVAD